MIWWLGGQRGNCKWLKDRNMYIYLQKCGLVNVNLKWVKDKVLDEAVENQRDLRATSILVSLIYSYHPHYVPIYRLNRYYRQLDLPGDVKLSTFIRRYPNIFHESSFFDTGGTPVPSFGLTPDVLDLHLEERSALQQNQMYILNKLKKLLLLTREQVLPLQTIDQLKWDLGLPFDYHQSLIPLHPGIFSFDSLVDGRVGLRLLSWDDDLTISHLQNSMGMAGKGEMDYSDCLAFPIGFTRGFGLKRKFLTWLNEWQKLPYTSPYIDASHLDPRTDVSEKRIVGVFHELLHLTLQKKTDRRNVSNLRKPLSLPQKFTKVFERHPGIFYISKKSDTQTVVLREAYDGHTLLEKHQLVDVREKLVGMMKEGFLDRSQGFYKKGNYLVLGRGRCKAGQLKNASLTPMTTIPISECMGH